MNLTTKLSILCTLCLTPYAVRPISAIFQRPAMPASPPHSLPSIAESGDFEAPVTRITQHALRSDSPSFTPPAGLKTELTVSQTAEAALKAKLEEDYDFSESDLKPSDVAPYYNPSHPPSRIAYFRQPGEPEILPLRRDKMHSFSGMGGTLNLTSEALAGRIALERKQLSDGRIPPLRSSSDSVSPDQKLTPLGESAWSVVRFTPGKNQEGKPIRLRKPIPFSLQGPDYSMEELEKGDQAGLDRVQAKVLSFGHNGELILGVEGGGVILDEAGPDFVVYENVFPIGGGILYQEFARVGVSDSLADASFRWFECDPERGKLSGCAGVVPTDEGGDAFDLGALGVKAIRYIKIRDWGKNNDSREINTEGFDLDAVRFIHAYKVNP